VEQKNDNGIKPRVANQISVEEALQNGHDDAAAGGGVAAVQADLLRAGRRLVAGWSLVAGSLVQSYGG
jgi:hypothetical protein